ncbi:MAG: hypothetical protein FWG17_02945 [Desulfovibrionaceae bacterium]|nr:hypothetical protein [Desulfovibrionaceae bacterium]
MADAPNIATEFHDKERNVTYRVMAFRKLEMVELLAAVKNWQLRTPQNKRRLKPGTMLTIPTVIR